MRIRVDLSIVPPKITLLDAENFEDFSVEVESPDHAWVRRESLENLAGARARDLDWQNAIENMLEYAATQGWVNSEGAMRAHITDA